VSGDRRLSGGLIRCNLGTGPDCPIALRLGGGEERVVRNFRLCKSGRNNQNVKRITTEIPPPILPSSAEIKSWHRLAVRGRAQQLRIERNCPRDSRPRLVKPGGNIAVKRVALIGNTDDRSVHVNVWSPLALRRVVNPIKPDARTSRRDRGQIDGRHRREPRAIRQEEQYNPGPGSEPHGCGGGFSGHQASTLLSAWRIDWFPPRDWLCRNHDSRRSEEKWPGTAILRLRR
jgi:hypothetical protein